MKSRCCKFMWFQYFLSFFLLFFSSLFHNPPHVILWVIHVCHVIDHIKISSQSSFTHIFVCWAPIRTIQDALKSFLWTLQNKYFKTLKVISTPTWVCYHQNTWFDWSPRANCVEWKLVWESIDICQVDDRSRKKWFWFGLEGHLLSGFIVLTFMMKTREKPLHFKCYVLFVHCRRVGSSMQQEH